MLGYRYDPGVALEVRATLARAALSLCFVSSSACTRSDTPTEHARAAPLVPSLVPVAAAATIAPTVRFVGRFEPSDDHGMRFAWSGSGIIGRFAGTGVSARLRDEGKATMNAFQVVVDGEPKKVLKMQRGRELYPLVSGLPDGVHDIAVYKRTEAEVGEVVFFGFEPEGKMLAAPSAPERRIELIGDSITAGLGNEGPGAICPNKPHEQNEYLTYGALAARELGADHTTIAWSGKTLYSMRVYFDRSLPAREHSVWDHARYEPQLVVINVGTNNFAIVDPGEARFTLLYTELYERVRRVHPQAVIACALGPMLSDVYPPGRRNLTQARKYMRAIVGKLKTRDSKVELLEFPEQKHADGMGCGFHPSLKTHKLMAERLVNFARERLGW
jgi:lysophospholipase L1-like esterase